MSPIDDHSTSTKSEGARAAFAGSRHQRRDFLKALSAGAFAACCAGSANAFTEAVDGCLLGFSTYGTRSMKTEAALKMLDRIGFDSVELAVWSDWDADSAAIPKERRAALRRQLESSAIVLTSLMEHVPPTDDKRHQNALERLSLAAELAHDLSPSKPPLIQTVLGGGNFEKSKETFRDRLGEWAELAERHDVTIAIKPHRGGVVSKPAEAIWLLKQLNTPQRLKMVYDYSHYAFRNLPLDDTIQMSLPHTVHVAVKDAVEDNDRVAFQLPGTAGTIDFPALIGGLHGGGYRGDISCEVSGMVWKRPDYDPQKAAETCYRNISAAMKKAGVPRRGRA